MQIIRYLNGSRLRGAMPALLLDAHSAGAVLREAAHRQGLPLPSPAHSAILGTEESGLRKDNTP